MGGSSYSLMSATELRPRGLLTISGKRGPRTKSAVIEHLKGNTDFMRLFSVYRCVCIIVASSAFVVAGCPPVVAPVSSGFKQTSLGDAS
jgi:hypothetical protein